MRTIGLHRQKSRSGFGLQRHGTNPRRVGVELFQQAAHSGGLVHGKDESGTLSGTEQFQPTIAGKVGEHHRTCAFEFGAILSNHRQISHDFKMIQSRRAQDVQINHTIGVRVPPHHRLGRLVVNLQRFPLPNAIVSNHPQSLLPHDHQVAVSILIQVHRQHRGCVRGQRFQTLHLSSP